MSDRSLLQGGAAVAGGVLLLVLMLLWLASATHREVLNVKATVNRIDARIGIHQ